MFKNQSRLNIYDKYNGFKINIKEKPLLNNFEIPFYSFIFERMKTIATVLTLFLAPILFAQTPESQTNINKKFKIGINQSIDICSEKYYAFNYNDQQKADFINSTITTKLGFCLGLGVVYQHKKKLGFELGLQYSNKGSADKEMVLKPLQPEPSLPEKIKTIYHYNYIDIPMLVHLNFGKNKLNFVGSIGITHNLLLYRRMTTWYYYTDRVEKKNPNIANNSFLRFYNFSPTVAMGLQYQASTKLLLRLQPKFKYSFFSTTKSKEMAIHNYSLGLNIGLYIGL